MNCHAGAAYPNNGRQRRERKPSQRCPKPSYALLLFFNFLLQLFLRCSPYQPGSEECVYHIMCILYIYDIIYTYIYIYYLNDTYIYIYDNNVYIHITYITFITYIYIVQTYRPAQSKLWIQIRHTVGHPVAILAGMENTRNSIRQSNTHNCLGPQWIDPGFCLGDIYHVCVYNYIYVYIYMYTHFFLGQRILFEIFWNHLPNPHFLNHPGTAGGLYRLPPVHWKLNHKTGPAILADDNPLQRLGKIPTNWFDEKSPRNDAFGFFRGSPGQPWTPKATYR